MTAGTGSSVPDPPGTRAPADPIARYDRRAMGSPLRLTLVGIDPPRADAAWSAVSQRIEEIEQALSRFRPTSDLVLLNQRAGDPRPIPVPRELAAALSASRRAWRVTDGLFDPRVLRDLERLGYHGVDGGGGQAGGGNGFEAAFAGRDHPRDEWLCCSPRESCAAVASPVDLGGIGKGLALRWAFRTLADVLPELAWRGVAPVAPDGAPAGAGPTVGALLEAGGDLVLRGAAPDPGPWLVGVEHPARTEPAAVIALEEGAVCTSSITVHTWQAADGRTVHHLLDPRTGEPGGAGLVSVTVAGPDPAWAEIWSKTLFLLGELEIAARARARGLAAWWIRDDGSLEMTPAARALTGWVDGET